MRLQLIGGVFGLFLLLPATAFAATWYVRPATTTATYGTEDGTSYANAWNGFSNIKQGTGGVMPGDTLFLDGSATYDENLTWNTSGSSGSPITIDGSYGGGSATIDGQGTTTIGITENGNYVTLSHLKIINCTSSGVYVNSNATTSLTFDTDTLSSDVQGILFAGSAVHSNVAITNSTFSNNTTAGVRYLISTDGLAPANWSVSGNSFSAGGEGIRLTEESGGPTSGFTQVSIHNNTFSGGITNTAILVSNQTNASALTNKDVQVYDNTISNVGTGILLQGVDSSTTDYTKNLVYGNTIASTTLPGGPMDLFYTRYLDVYDNSVSDGTTSTIDSDGILVDNGNDYVRVHNNTITNMAGIASADNSGVAIMVLADSNVAVYSNEAEGNKQGFWYGGGGQTNVSVYGNTFLDNADSGVWLNSQEDAADLSQLTVSNNIFTGKGSGYGLNNLSTGGGSSSWSSNLLSDFSTNYVNYTAGASDVLTNPLVTSSTTPTLSQLSPAIDAGSTTTAATTDYSGNPIYGTPDIGAYEYQPPYTMGTNDVNATGAIRIYEDGKYRYTTATSTASSMDFSVTPLGGSFYSFGSTATRPSWLDLSNITWNTSGTYAKEWTATGQGATTTVFTVGNLVPDAWYTVSIDNVATSTTQANASGRISYAYTDGWSTPHTFDVNATNATCSLSLDKSFIYSGQSATLTWTTTNGLSASIDNNIGSVALNGSTSISPTVGNHTYKLTVTGGGSEASTTCSTTLQVSSFSGPSAFGYQQVAPEAVRDAMPTATNITAQTVPSASEALIHTRDLTMGDTGADVAALQQFLIADGYSIPAGATGYFGSQTRTALVAYQEAKDINPPTGYFGPLTRASITGTTAFAPTLTTSTSTLAVKGVLSLGSRGTQVTVLQQVLSKLGFLHVSPTGFYGPLTTKAVQIFQSTYDIVSSGTPSTTGYGAVGPRTKEKLNTLMAWQ